MKHLSKLPIKQFIQRYLLIVPLLFSTLCYGEASAGILLAKSKVAQLAIVLPGEPSPTRQFAAAELAKYLQKISGATFQVAGSPAKSRKVIRIEQRKEMAYEDYRISVRDGNIVLAAGSDRAVLYAVYDFLERLGCRWIAPQLALYNGLSEYIPHQPTLYYKVNHEINEHPAFAYRKLDIEEGKSHTIENLKQLVDWMPKLRYNTLMVPLNYQGKGRVKWDKWREALTPELRKRGILIEVGGHGYQNYINPGMENGNLFKQHPDWFGLDKDCKPATDDYLVFNTENQDAVNYFIKSVLEYLRQHPEIDIFDLWPPDGARWAECPDWLKRGTPEDRQAKLISKVDSAVKAVYPHLKLQIIAYAKALLPPQHETISKQVMVDFCPIDQNFEYQINDSRSAANQEYVTALLDWRKKFDGDIGLYSYFRKYAWKSLPNVIPHFIQRDMQWYAKVPLQGITTYAEPGDWYTYELNHYILGYLAWNPDVKVDSLIQLYCKTRYGAASAVAEKAYAALENTVRIYGSIRFSSLKSPEAISKAVTLLRDRQQAVKEAAASAPAEIQANFGRLQLMLQYAILDIRVREALAINASPEVLSDRVQEVLTFFKNNGDKGIVIVNKEDNVKSLTRYYNRYK
ncbi:DUF4838 domain-containing protein [Pedobacter sp. BS3]|uniref:DUF4838 domain-containing protein n=1 Tax=Pedobacter sp. BS3 TaxID=2567937 RepID=UPI0016593A0F|nr:DUF4838 domain-containing protein [Pedobacter sp. BS3]